MTFSYHNAPLKLQPNGAMQMHYYYYLLFEMHISNKFELKYSAYNVLKSAKVFSERILSVQFTIANKVTVYLLSTILCEFLKKIIH